MAVAVDGQDLGWAGENHGGGVAVAVARSTAMPLCANMSMISSSHPNSYSPLAGSSQVHENTPRVTNETPARSHQLDVLGPHGPGRCSGL